MIKLINMLYILFYLIINWIFFNCDIIIIPFVYIYIYIYNPNTTLGHELSRRRFHTIVFIGNALREEVLKCHVADRCKESRWWGSIMTAGGRISERVEAFGRPPRGTEVDCNLMFVVRYEDYITWQVVLD